MLQHQILLKSLGALDLRELNKTAYDFSNKQVPQKDKVNQFDSINEDSAKNSVDVIKLQERIAVLVVAYHNLGVEMEFQKRVQI